MQCFNCGQDADMEVFMMVNGKMKKLSICMECYKEQTEMMMEDIQDEDGNIDPEKIQKQMFEFYQNNKEEFDLLLGQALEDVDMDNAEFSPVDFPKMNFENIFNQMNSNRKSNFAHRDRNEENPFRSFGKDSNEANKFNPAETNSQRQIKIIQRSVDRKKDELLRHVEAEDYLKAAGARDELREMNKKIMIIKRLEKEGEC